MEKDMSRRAAELMKNKDALSRLAQTEDARQLMELLRQGAGGQETQTESSPDAILKRLKHLMGTAEGSRLIQRINEQAKQNGLTR